MERIDSDFSEPSHRAVDELNVDAFDDFDALVPEADLYGDQRVSHFSPPL